MDIPFLSSGKCVLLVGDDGVSIYKTGGRLQAVGTVFWQSPEFEAQLLQLLRQIGQSKPVLILYNMIEQHYRGNQHVPGHVAMFDRMKVVQNRMNAAFPNFPLRAALPTKAQKNAPKDGQHYLLAAVPYGDQLKKMMRAIEKSLMPIAGFALLPVEAAPILDKLATKSFKGSKPEWRVLIAQGEAGGLRQIVTKDGVLALTRLTTVSDIAANPDRWAEEVEQEFRATLSYLSRFGYAEGDNIDLVVLAGQEYHKTLFGHFGVVENLQCLDTKQAAKMLGIPVENTLTDHHAADKLFVSAIARQAKVIMPITAPEIDRIKKPRDYASLLQLVFLIVLAFMGYGIYQAMGELGQLKAQNAQVSQQIIKTQAQYDEEWEKISTITDNPRRLKSRIALDKDLQDYSVPLMTLVEQLYYVLRPFGYIEQLRVGGSSPSSGTQDQALSTNMFAAPEQVIEFDLRLEGSVQTNPKDRDAFITNVKDQIKGFFPEADIEVVGMDQGLFETGAIREVLGQSNGAQNQNAVTYLPIRIEGALITPLDAGQGGAQ